MREIPKGSIVGVGKDSIVLVNGVVKKLGGSIWGVVSEPVLVSYAGLVCAPILQDATGARFTICLPFWFVVRPGKFQSRGIPPEAQPAEAAAQVFDTSVPEGSEITLLPTNIIDSNG